MNIITITLSLFFNLSHAQVVICGEETADQVNSCTLNDRLPQIINEHYPVKWKSYEDYTAPDTCVPVVDDPNTVDIDETFNCPVWNPSANSYTFLPYNKDAPLTLYERLLMEQKPTEAELIAHLDAWKAAELADIAFKNRVDSLPYDIRPMAEKCGLGRPNMALLIKAIKDNKDEAKLACIESKKVEVENEQLAEKARLDRIKKGRQAREFSNYILDIIAGYNIERKLTKGQINQMMVTFKDIFDALKAGRPDTAKELINAITPDGTIVTQEMKDAILLEYSKAGL